MQQALLEHLRKITEEEQRILDGASEMCIRDSEQGTYIGGGKKNVFADIFDRKCLIHVMFSDVAFDHMDGWILMCLISRMFQKVFSLPAKRLMELGKGKRCV